MGRRPTNRKCRNGRVNPAGTSEPPAAAEPEEEGVPDWLKGLGAAAVGAAAVGAAQVRANLSPNPNLLRIGSRVCGKPRQRWKRSKRSRSREEAEIPEWLRETGAAPQAIGGPQAYEQEVPDWARESVASEPAAATRPEEEDVPDWLKGLGMAAVGAAAVGALQGEPAPNQTCHRLAFESAAVRAGDGSGASQQKKKRPRFPSGCAIVGLRHKPSAGRKPTNKKCPIGCAKPNPHHRLFLKRLQKPSNKAKSPSGCVI